MAITSSPGPTVSTSERAVQTEPIAEEQSYHADHTSTRLHWQRHDELNLRIYESITKSAIHDVQR